MKKIFKYQVIRVNENNEVIEEHGIKHIYDCKTKREVKKLVKTQNFTTADKFYRVIETKTNKLVRSLSDKRIFINGMLATEF